MHFARALVCHIPGKPKLPAHGGSEAGITWADHVDIQREGAEAWITLAEGKNEEALRQMRSAADHEDSTLQAPGMCATLQSYKAALQMYTIRSTILEIY